MIPEPATGVLAASGLICLFAGIRKRKSGQFGALAKVALFNDKAGGI